MRRLLWTLGSFLAAVVLVGGGWFAALAFTSPEQWAAQAAAPAPIPILAEVTQGDLIDERTLGATIVPTSTAVATLAAVDGAARSIVTASDLEPGTGVSTGTVLVRVNGEPVLALASPFPFYRDLGVGDSGPDVRLLQQNLTDLGLLTAVDGEFGVGTATAVAALYRGARATAPTRVEATNTGSVESEGVQIAEAPSYPYLPLSAVATVSALPATLASVPSVGADLADGAVVSFSATTGLLRLSVPPDLAAVLVTGTELACAVGDATDIACRIDDLFDATADVAGVGGGDQVMTWADVVPVDGAIGTEQFAQRASVRVQVATLAEDALLVPVIAVAQQSAESGTVLLHGEESFETVEVGIIAVLNGTAAIRGDLQAGDYLRVD